MNMRGGIHWLGHRGEDTSLGYLCAVWREKKTRLLVNRHSPNVWIIRARRIDWNQRMRERRRRTGEGHRARRLSMQRKPMLRSQLIRACAPTVSIVSPVFVTNHSFLSLSLSISSSSQNNRVQLFDNRDRISQSFEILISDKRVYLREKREHFTLHLENSQVHRWQEKEIKWGLRSTRAAMPLACVDSHMSIELFYHILIAKERSIFVDLCEIIVWNVGKMDSVPTYHCCICRALPSDVWCLLPTPCRKGD